MCEKLGDDMNVRELIIDGGKLRQCLECGAIGVEIGTAYLTTTVDELPTLLRWVDGLIESVERDPDPQKKSYLQIEGSRIFMAFTREHLTLLHRLLRRGNRQLRFPSSDPPSLSASVH